MPCSNIVKYNIKNSEGTCKLYFQIFVTGSTTNSASIGNESYIITRVKVKVKLTLEQAMKTQGERSIALLFL